FPTSGYNPILGFKIGAPNLIGPSWCTPLLIGFDYQNQSKVACANLGKRILSKRILLSNLLLSILLISILLLSILFAKYHFVKYFFVKYSFVNYSFANYLFIITLQQCNIAK